MITKVKTQFDFKSDLEESLQFQLILLGLIGSDRTMSIRQLICNNLCCENTFLSLPCTTMLASDLVIGRDFCSALTISMCLKTQNFSLVRASLKRLNAFLRIKEGNFLSANKNIRELWYLQTKDHVLFPGLDMILKKEDFERLMSPVVSLVIDGQELHQNSIYSAIYSRRKASPPCKDFDYSFYCVGIDRALEKEEDQDPRQNQISSEIKFHLYQDKLGLARRVALGYTKDNFKKIYNYFTA